MLKKKNAFTCNILKTIENVGKLNFDRLKRRLNWKQLFSREKLNKNADVIF